MSATTWGWLVVLLPLAGCVTIGLGWRSLPGRSAGWLGTLAIGLSFACACVALAKMLGRPPDHRQMTSSLWDYAVTVGIDARMQILLDPLSLFMALVVSGVSTLIHLYSITYMTRDEGFRRYFSYLNYFVFSMLLLVMAGNFLLLIIGWAFVGAASYLLISFWYRRLTATRAGIKAFVMNVIGDIGLVLGTFFIFRHSHTLDFLGTFHAAQQGAYATGHSHADLVAGCILLLVGAFAKSAQIPLHTWLPDAMEGPTPVSALIHAATMVTAGVYLIARMHPLFERAPAAADVGVAVGCLTLIVAATIGLVVTDIKRVIAYSTMSQIGYMIMGVSAGAYAAGLFHLMTHAFFKALLFMCAGSVIGAMAGAQDMDRMRGFRKALPFTFATFVVGGLALSGFPPFSGWWSKDEIIGTVAQRGGAFWVCYAVGLLGALLTAIYTFRMIFRVFFGEPVAEARELEQGHLHHAEVHINPTDGTEEDTDVGFPGPEHFVAERELPMKVSMGLLAVLATVGGLVQIPGVTHAIERFLHPAFAGSRYFDSLRPSDTFSYIGLGAGAAIAIIGISIAYLVWFRRPALAVAARERLTGVYRLFVNKWYFDELIDALVVRPTAWFGRWAQQTFERIVVDGAFVGGSTGLVRAGSAVVRTIQSGLLRTYAALLVLGLVGVAAWFLSQS